MIRIVSKIPLCGGWPGFGFTPEGCTGPSSWVIFDSHKTGVYNAQLKLTVS
jgi:hypothetical protein